MFVILRQKCTNDPKKIIFPGWFLPVGAAPSLLAVDDFNPFTAPLAELGDDKVDSSAPTDLFQYAPGWLSGLGFSACGMNSTTSTFGVGFGAAYPALPRTERAKNILYIFASHRSARARSRKSNA